MSVPKGTVALYEGASVINVVREALTPPVTNETQEGIWVMSHGLVSLDLGTGGACLMVELSACQYGRVTPECDADLAEAALLIKELGYTRTGTTEEEDGLVLLELL